MLFPTDTLWVRLRHTATSAWSSYIPNHQQGNFQTMAHGIDGGAEDNVFQAFVSMRAHDDQVGLQFLREANNRGCRILGVTDDRFDTHPLALQRIDNLGQISTPGFDFRSG